MRRLRSINDRLVCGCHRARMTKHRTPLALLLALAAAPLVAQEAAPAPPDDDAEIVVEAPRSVPAPPPPPGERSTTTGAPLMVLTLRMPVLYGDLDLASPADRARLDTRIRNVAVAACAALDRAWPLTSDPDCARAAAANAQRSLSARLAAISK